MLARGPNGETCEMDATLIPSMEEQRARSDIDVIDPAGVDFEKYLHTDVGRGGLVRAPDLRSAFSPDIVPSGWRNSKTGEPISEKHQKILDDFMREPLAPTRIQQIIPTEEPGER